MGRGVQEEGSSSPNDRVRLNRSERTGIAGEQFKLEFSDGSCFFVSEQDLREEGIFPLELVPGFELPQATVAALHRSSRRRRTLEKALSLLARAPHATAGLRMKLLKRGYDREVIEQAIQWLTEKGYLDDSSFAEQWLHSRIDRHPEGRARLVSGLLSRGVSREAAEQAVECCVSPQVEKQSAVRFLEKLKRRGVASPELQEKKLKARGFSFTLTREVLEEEGRPDSRNP